MLSPLGTVLASSRGGFNLDTIISFLQRHRICHLYVIGGDGTHRYELDCGCDCDCDCDSDCDYDCDCDCDCDGDCDCEW